MGETPTPFRFREYNRLLGHKPILGSFRIDHDPLGTPQEARLSVRLIVEEDLTRGLQELFHLRETIVTFKVTDWVRFPEVPVTFTATVPVAALALALSVSTLVVVAGLAEKLAVTPFGNPEAASLTLPVKPATGVMTIVLLALLP